MVFKIFRKLGCASKANTIKAVASGRRETEVDKEGHSSEELLLQFNPKKSDPPVVKPPPVETVVSEQTNEAMQQVATNSSSKEELFITTTADVDAMPIYPTVAAVMGLKDAFGVGNLGVGEAGSDDHQSSAVQDVENVQDDMEEEEQQEEKPKSQEISAQKEDSTSSDPPVETITESQAVGESGMKQDDGEQNILQKIQYACCGIGA